jgi:hypothetical protein
MIRWMPEVPNIFAPPGQLNPHLKLGTRVVAYAELRETTIPGWRGWRRAELREPVEGIITGLRLPYSGRYQFPWIDEPGWPRRWQDRMHRAYLVAFHIRKEPLRVLAQDLELL